MKEYNKNPRKISKKQLIELEANLKELGDISGIVHDLNSGEIIGGNQRTKVLNIQDCEIEIVKEFETPTEQGTVALGFVVWQGERFNYRKVLWTPEQCEKANVTANKMGGTWDFDVLKEHFNQDKLLTFGFDEWELAALPEDNSPEKKASGKQYDDDDFDDDGKHKEKESCKCPKCGFEWQK